MRPPEYSKRSDSAEVAWRIGLRRVVPVLDAVQLRVQPVEGHQLVVGALFFDHTVFDHDDLVGVADGAQSMGDAKNGAALHQSLQGFNHQMFGLRIEGCGGFVKRPSRGWLARELTIPKGARANSA